MKITSVEIHPSGSTEVVVLSFRDPRRQNPFNVKGITGLDAEQIVPRYYGVSGAKKLYNLSLESRDIAVQVELNPSPGVAFSDLRDILYKSIASSRTGLVELQFKNGTDVVAAVSGFVSKLESDLFQKSTDIKLTINCSDPLLKAPTRTDLDILLYDLASSNIQDTMSTAPHGFVFSVGFLSDLASLTITPDDDSWSFSVVPYGGFLAADILHFSSELNNKYLYIVRDGDTIHLADVISPGSVWPILFPGDNIFEFADPTDLSWESISYYATYWGV